MADTVLDGAWYFLAARQSAFALLLPLLLRQSSARRHAPFAETDRKLLSSTI